MRRLHFTLLFNMNPHCYAVTRRYVVCNQLRIVQLPIILFLIADRMSVTLLLFFAESFSLSIFPMKGLVLWVNAWLLFLVLDTYNILNILMCDKSKIQQQP